MSIKHCALAALVALAFAGTAQAGKFDSVVTVRNGSLWEIHQMYLSSVEEEEWGPDQLGEQIIEAQGGSFKLTGVPCDSYDVRLVDEDGDECVVREVDLCGDDATWSISDEDLLECQVETE
jgi:hypothetical protein